MKVEITFEIVESIPIVLYKVECYLIVLARISSSTKDCEETIEVVATDYHAFTFQSTSMLLLLNDQ